MDQECESKSPLGIDKKNTWRGLSLVRSLVRFVCGRVKVGGCQVTTRYLAPDAKRQSH